MKTALPPIRTIDLDGPIAYRVWEGPEDLTFVLVHGLGGANINWMEVAPALAGLGRVLALDLPGFGWSPLAGRRTGLMDLRRTLSSFLSAKAGGLTVLCGNSMGGALGVFQAAIEPSSLGGLVLSSSVYPWIRRGFPHPVVALAFAVYDTPGIGEQAVAARLKAFSPDRLVRWSFRYLAADPSRISHDVIEAHEELIGRLRDEPEATVAFLQAARSLLRLGRRQEVSRRALDAVRCPVLVLHGRRDRFVPALLAEAELRRHPAWRGRIFPDVGHVPQMEAPGRWVAEVADWYSSHLA
jgi:pimeloyl-ACP methyl ester carboxylesterase